MEQIIFNNKYRIIDSKYSKQGSFGAVFKAINIQTNQLVAVKEIKEKIGNDGLGSTVIRENAILNFLNDKNIVTLTDSFIQDEKAYLVFPYFQMNLREFIIKQYNSKVPQPVIKKIMTQLLSALKTAHNSRFMHRDIKLENILVETSKDNPQNFTLKLADWGSSRKFNICANQNFTYYVIPRPYRAPELLFKSRKYSQTVDIWCVGCLFYELLLGKMPFQRLSRNIILNDIMQMIGLSEVGDEKWIVEMYSLHGNFECYEEDLKNYRKKSLDSIFKKQFDNVPPACDLLKKLLKINPEKRISASDALKHPYFDFNN